MENRDKVEQTRIRRDVQARKARARAAKRKRAITLAVLGTVFSLIVILGSAYIVLHCISDKESLREAGIAAYSEQNYEEAKKDLIASLGETQWFTEKMDDDTRLYLAACYMKTGDYLDAIDQYNTLIYNGTSVAKQDELEGYISLANALDVAGDGKFDDKTLKTLKQEIENGNTSVSIILGGYYETTGDYDKMVEYYDMYTADYGMNTYVAYQMSSYYLMNDNIDAAQNVINQGIASGDDLFLDKLLFNDLVITERSKDYQAAYDKISSLVQKYPNDETFKREYDYLNSRVNFNTEPVNSEEE